MPEKISRNDNRRRVDIVRKRSVYYRSSLQVNKWNINVSRDRQRTTWNIISHVWSKAMNTALILLLLSFGEFNFQLVILLIRLKHKLITFPCEMMFFNGFSTKSSETWNLFFLHPFVPKRSLKMIHPNVLHSWILVERNKEKLLINCLKALSLNS